jgi:hypothetical protein
MNSIFDKLNLRPQERRLVVIVAIVVFVVLNFWLVFPMFGEYGKLQRRIIDGQTMLAKYEAEIKNKPGYVTTINTLQGDVGYIPSEDAALRLYQEVNSQANLTGLGYTLITPAVRGGGGSGKTNAFFDETSVTVNIRTGEKELVDFLNRLTDKELMIRAKSMDIGPDPTRMMLQGSITLVKSFQRKPPLKAAMPAATAAPKATALPKTNAPPKPAPAAPAPKATNPPTRSAPTAIPPLPGGTNRPPKRGP